MNMSLSLSCGPALRLAIRPSTDSAFPTVEKWLKVEANRDALQWTVEGHCHEQYMGLIDFLLCEILTKYERGCMAYYRGKGPKYVTMVGPLQRKADEAVVLTACVVAVACWEQLDQRPSFKDFRETVLQHCGLLG